MIDRAGAGRKPTRIIVDCTHTFHTGASTGIQRVVRRQADGLLELGRRQGLEVVPVRIEAGYPVPLPVAKGRAAFPTAASAREKESLPPAALRVQAVRSLGHRANVLRLPPVRRWLDAGPNAFGLARVAGALRREPPPAQAMELGPDDVFLSLDSSWVYDIRSALDRAGRAGATRIAVLCDVLPLSDPQWFTQGTREWFAQWLSAILPRLEGVVTISRATAGELRRLVQERTLRPSRMPAVEPVLLGAELEPPKEAPIREPLAAALAPGRPPAFLTVGTLEPRKNVAYAIDIFDALLERGRDVQWHLVGAHGWLAEETVERIRGHVQFGHRLHWWTDLADAELHHAYRHAAALVGVSKAEGFGLPLVEARLQGLPVFASDIPVFREVLGREGHYLPLGSATLAATVLEDFLDGTLPCPERGQASKAARPWIESAAELLEVALRLHAARRAAATTPPAAAA